MTGLRSREIYKGFNVTLITVESIDFRPGTTNFGFHFSGTIEPIAVIVSGPDGTYGLGIDGQALDVDQLRRDIPDIWSQRKYRDRALIGSTDALERFDAWRAPAEQ